MTTVVVMGPVHYADLRGASVTNATVFRTPLGDVPMSAKARCSRSLQSVRPRTALRRAAAGLVAAVPAERRPPSTQPTLGSTRSRFRCPFLQRTLKNFELVPVVCGEVDEEQAARALQQILDDRTLIVVSSDLSHYYPYAEARELDQHTVEAICRLDPDAVGEEDACGHTPIRILLYVARQKGWKARLLD